VNCAIVDKITENVVVAGNFNSAAYSNIAYFSGNGLSSLSNGGLNGQVYSMLYTEGNSSFVIRIVIDKNSCDRLCVHDGQIQLNKRWESSPERVCRL
jgi:hypothetical protein